MAVRGQEVELLGDGIRADSPTKGAFALNMLYRRNSWEVRRGFGQVVELDTTMRAGRLRAAVPLWGYKEHLGSYAMTTSFGHEQIVSVFTADVWSGDRPADTSATFTRNSTLSHFISIYIVDIYDVTTGDRWEEPIFRHTSEFGETSTSRLEMPDWHGHYETWWEGMIQKSPASRYYKQYPGSNLTDRQQWLLVSEPAETFFFTEMNDILYFGNNDTGLLAYIPSVFRGRTRGDNNLSVLGRDKQVTTVYDRSWAPPYSETSVVINAVATDGPFSEGITYLSRSEFPSPKGGASIGGRLVLFEGTNVYFSDVGYPTSIAADNVMSVPSEDNITAIREHNGVLIIFTATETWYYQPSAGFAASAGRLVRLSESVGCLGGSAITKADNSLIWMDKRGVYILGTGTSPPEKISTPIEPFFNDYISNPLTNFFLDNGELPAPTLGEQTAVSFKRVGPVSAAYDRELDAVIFSLPSINAALYLSGGKWSLWSTETMVSAPGTPPASRRTANINSPWVVTFDKGMYLVGSVPPDEAGQTLDTGVVSRSYYVLKYGRGGAVDRSVEATEDYRLVRGYWEGYNETSIAITPPTSDHYLYVGKPIPIPKGSELGDLASPANMSPAADAVDGAVWVPISLVLGQINHLGAVIPSLLPDQLSLIFTFDSTNWAPIGRPPVSSDVQFFLPPERQSTHARWVVSFSGSNLTITFNTGGGSWMASPRLSLNKRQLNRLIYIPFKPISTTTTIGPNLTPTTATLVDEADSGNNPIAMRTFVWDETFLFAQRHEDNDVAQAVDWAYKSAPVQTEDVVQIKGRGLFMNVLSHGAATSTHRLVDTWPFGLLNILSAPDTKGWSSQVIDVTTEAGAPYPSSVTNVVGKNTLRTRYARNTSTALTTNTFNTANGPIYGTPGAAMGTNRPEIVADEEIGQLAVSDSVRGQSFTYMMWGSLQNKAERVILESARAVMRILGGKKRRGR